jgi:hypothetical protein
MKTRSEQNKDEKGLAHTDTQHGSSGGMTSDPISRRIAFLITFVQLTDHDNRV